MPFEAYKSGCNEAITRTLNNSIRVIGWFSILFSLLEVNILKQLKLSKLINMDFFLKLLALVSARCLDNSIWKRKRRLKRNSIF